MFPFDIASKQAQIQKYEEEINKQDFWDDNEKAQKILQQNSDLKNIIAEFEGLNSDLEEIEILIELGLEEEDESIEHDIEKSIKKLEDKIDEVKIKTLLNGKYDVNNAVLSIPFCRFFHFGVSYSHLNALRTKLSVIKRCLLT